MSTTPSSFVTEPDLPGWLRREGWKIDRPCPCCPSASTPTFHAASPCGRLILHAADPYEVGTLLYSLSPATGSGSWLLTMPGELAVSVLVAARDALGPATAPPPIARQPSHGLDGIDLLDHALRRIRQEVVTIYLRVDEDADRRAVVGR